MQTKSSATADVRHVNYQSDFRVVFSFPENKLPEYPWRLELSTPNTAAYNAFMAWFDGTEYHNCLPLEDGTLLVTVDNHNLAPGLLSYKLTIDAPDGAFPDGEMNVTTPGELAIELWYGPSEELSNEEINVIVITLKGDKPVITSDEEGNIYADGELLTDVIANAVASFSKFEEQAKKDEQARVDAENGRKTAEDTRVSNENARKEAETKREEAEKERQTNTSTAIENCENAAQNANDEADRVKQFADNPPKIVDVDGVRYWAFWDEATQQYVTSENRADGVPLYASFYVDPETMDLFAVYPEGYGDGPTFSLNNGDLSVTINE